MARIKKKQISEVQLPKKLGQTLSAGSLAELLECGVCRRFTFSRLAFPTSPIGDFPKAPGCGALQKLRQILALALACLLLSGCQTERSASQPPLHRYSFNHPAMGTLFTIEFYATNDVAAKDAAKAAFKRVDDLEDVMSDYQADSELMKLCEHPYGQPVPVSQDLFDAL